jgi:hypothetical protein
MWSKKWHWKRNTSISCDGHLLNELQETDVPWDDAIVVSARKLWKLWDYLSEPRSSLCERRLERRVPRPALLPVKSAQFTHFFRQVWRHTVKSLSLTELSLFAYCLVHWWVTSQNCPFASEQPRSVWMQCSLHKAVGHYTNVRSSRHLLAFCRPTLSSTLQSTDPFLGSFQRPSFQLCHFSVA